MVGFSVNTQVVTLLFWNGQALGEPALSPVGKFKAAQIKFRAMAEIDAKALRRWLKKAGSKFWDFRALRKRRLPLKGGARVAGASGRDGARFTMERAG